MTRENTVSVQLKSGAQGSPVTFCAGQRFSLQLEPGKVASTWGDGSPITLAEFEEVLAPQELFEIAPENSAPASRGSTHDKEE